MVTIVVAIFPVEDGPFGGALASGVREAGGSHSTNNPRMSGTQAAKEVRDVSIPNFIPLHKLGKIHPALRGMFPIMPEGYIKPVGKIRCFLKNWEVLTQDPQVLDVVESFSIPFMKEPLQSRIPPACPLKPDEMKLVDKEVEEMIQKGAIQEVSPIPGQFVSSIFIVEKKDSGYRPVINLKKLNQYIPYQHFKMESLDL